MNSATRPRPHFAGRSSESGALGRVRFAGGRMSKASDQRTGDAARARVALGALSRDRHKARAFERRLCAGESVHAAKSVVARDVVDVSTTFAMTAKGALCLAIVRASK